MSDISQIKYSLNELRQACGCPKLYVANFFSDFQFKVDIASEKFLAESSTKDTPKILSEALDCQVLMAEQLKKLENECIDYLEDKEPSIIEQILKEVDRIESYLEAYIDEKRLNELNDLLYVSLKTFQKAVLLNRSILFLTYESSILKSLSNFDVPVLFGMLVIVGDELIDQKALLKE